MMDIRKKLFLMSKLLHPNGATRISDGEQHFCPTLSITCILPGTWDLLPFPTGEESGVSGSNLSCKVFPLAEKKVGEQQGPWWQPGLLVFSSCPKRLGLSSPNHMPRKPQELHHCLQPHQGDVHLWISEASDFHSRGMGVLSGEHHCSHVPQLFVEL